VQFIGNNFVTPRNDDMQDKPPLSDTADPASSSKNDFTRSNNTMITQKNDFLSPRIEESQPG